MVRLTKGFTLVELLVVISIIATLTAVLLPNFMGAREKAKDSQKIQEANSLKNALRNYYNDYQAYPSPANVNGPLANSFATEGYISSVGTGYSYESSLPYESFNICVPITAGQGDEDENSQVRCGAKTIGVCGMNVGMTAKNSLFVVCAK